MDELIKILRKVTNKLETSEKELYQAFTGGWEVMTGSLYKESEVLQEAKALIAKLTPPV